MYGIVLKKYGIIALKICIIACAWWYVAHKITSMPQDALLLFNNPRFSYPYIALVMLLMVANWTIEAIKWKFLAEKIQTISLYTSLQAICIGMPLALVTPNRIGEIGGRSLVVKQHKKKTMLATLLGSIIQLTTTLIFGIIGFVLYLIFAKPISIISNAGYIALLILCVCVALYFLFRNAQCISRFAKRILGRHKYVSLIKTYRMFTTNNKLTVFAFSMLRYIIFSGQFMILVHMLLPEITIVELCISVFLTYFFTTIIPTSVLGEVGIRGSVAMVVFGMFTPHEITIFQVSMLLWIINIAIPTLWGSYILIRYKK